MLLNCDYNPCAEDKLLSNCNTRDSRIDDETNCNFDTCLFDGESTSTYTTQIMSTIGTKVFTDDLTWDNKDEPQLHPQNEPQITIIITDKK